jgi:hypothetical protein
MKADAEMIAHDDYRLSSLYATKRDVYLDFLSFHKLRTLSSSPQARPAPSYVTFARCWKKDFPELKLTRYIGDHRPCRECHDIATLERQVRRVVCRCSRLCFCALDLSISLERCDE